MDARIEIAERQHLEVLEQRVDAVDAGQQRRHDDHRAGVVGHAVGEVEPRQPLRADDAARPACWTHAIARSLAGSSTSSATSELDGGDAARVPRVGQRAGDQQRRSAIAIAPR